MNAQVTRRLGHLEPTMFNYGPPKKSKDSDAAETSSTQINQAITVNTLSDANIIWPIQYTQEDEEKPDSKQH